MEFDVDAALAILLPWDLVLKIGGKKFATRPPTVGQLASLAVLAERKDAAAHGETMRVIGSMFVKSDEAMAAMTIPACIVASRRIVAYAEEYAKKNSGAIDAAARGQVQAVSDGKNSLPAT